MTRAKISPRRICEHWGLVRFDKPGRGGKWITDADGNRMIFETRMSAETYSIEMLAGRLETI